MILFGEAGLSTEFVFYICGILPQTAYHHLRVHNGRVAHALNADPLAQILDRPPFLACAIFATVFGSIPDSRLSCASEACDHSGRPSNRWRASHKYRCSDGVRGRGARVTNLSHIACFHSCERIASSNHEIRHLASVGD